MDAKNTFVEKTRMIFVMTYENELPVKHFQNQVVLRLRKENGSVGSFLIWIIQNTINFALYYT